MEYTVNLALQVLPLGIPKKEAYKIVDTAIEQIKSSGLVYKICPFETVVEGPYGKVMDLIAVVQEACNNAGANEVLINMKLQRNFTNDVHIDDKMEKYQ